jgi:diguanylate cyclase
MSSRQRLYLLAIAATPVHIAHVVLFLPSEPGPIESALLWHTDIWIAHAVMASLITLAAGNVHAAERRGARCGRLGEILPTAVALAYLAFGVVISTTDHLVTPAITTFIAACAGTAVVILMRPAVAILLYLAVECHRRIASRRRLRRAAVN